MQKLTSLMLFCTCESVVTVLVLVSSGRAGLTPDSPLFQIL